MDKKEITDKLRKNKGLLRENFSILKIALFGSYSTNTFTKDSDIDIAFELEEGKKMGLKEFYELELFLKRLFQVEKIDLVNMKYMNPIIESEIENTLIYV